MKVGEATDIAVEDNTDILTLTFPDGGMVRLEFEEQNWVDADNTRYQVEGLSNLRSILEEMINEELSEAMRPVPTLVIEANDHIFYVDPEDNSSEEALIEKLSTGAIELELHDYGSFEKVGPLPWELLRNDESITTVPGDVIFYQGNQITIYYDENTWDFIRLAKQESCLSLSECHEVFKPYFKEAFWARHTPATRKLTCPSCGHHGFCVEVAAGSEVGQNA